VLKASHIRPWADCTSGDRLNKYNGIALSANADALFDRYLISFNDSGKILISPNLPPGLLKTLGLNPNQEISIPALCRPFLNYHRRMFKTKNNARG
jgi:predicted restriction endonuclease